MNRGAIRGQVRARTLARTLGMLVTLMALASGGAQAAGVVRVTQRDSSGVRVTTLSSAGLDVVSSQRGCARCRPRPLSHVVISFRRGRVLLVDPAHRVYETGTVKALFALARRESAKATKPVRIPELGEVARPPTARVTSAGQTRIAGVEAAGVVIIQGSLQERVWYAKTLPKPPAGVQHLFGGLDSATSDALAKHLRATHGALVLRVEARSGNSWRRLLDTTRVTRLRRFTPTLRAPARYRRRALAPGAVKAQASSVPGALINLGIGPVVGHPRIFPIYWGSWFAHNPGFVTSLNGKLRQMVEGHDGYMAGLRQYGITPGSFGSGFTNREDPPASVGTWNFFATEGMLFGHLGINGTPRGWGRLDANDPIIMVFVPQSAVFSAMWDGYHFGVATEAGLFPWNQPLMPYTIVKVHNEDPSTQDTLNEATIVASHEFDEAATDPDPFFSWVSPLNEPVWSEGEVSDICGDNSAPWASETRLGGISYATYWSDTDRACVPSSRPSPRITAPGPNSSWPCGSVPLHATATDPFDGTITDPTRFRWTEGLTPIATGSSTTATLSPGIHHLTLTVTDSQLQSASASVTVTVNPPAPQPAISSPDAHDTWDTDQSVPFDGTATTSCEGTLPASSLVWTENGVTIGTGNTFSHMFTTQGSHTVVLTATSSQHVPGQQSVTFNVGPASGNPSPQINAPTDGTNEPDASHVWTFSGSATDPHDGNLSGASLQWDDTYTDSNHVQHVQQHLGQGTSFTHTLYWNGATPTTHVIRLVATDSLGHSSVPVSVTVSAGAFP